MELHLSPDPRWKAVLARDASFDGAFVFGVRSTGVYCRPSCPARRPRRENVVFFQVAAAAEQAGFRSCRRCRPRDTGASAQARLLQRVCRHIETHAGERSITLDELGAVAGISPHHLQRTFKRVMGISPRQYADAHRMSVFKARVKGGQDVTEATYEAGYGSSSRLYERAAAQLGMTPATYRRGGRGMTIAYTLVDSPLGRLLVGATERGISCVCLGDSDRALETALREEYPAATLQRDDARLAGQVKAVLELASGRARRSELPLDIQATAFQRRVWEALRRIPRGQTRSYGQIARELGQPDAARAVARACATNPVALVIPCHRVVGEGGALRGYRWGVERKRALLGREQQRRAR
jgi:AraC family transcriptional regulator of adaptative response/methylated-DNA-[protein]-cysteine methyltransferase